MTKACRKCQVEPHINRQLANFQVFTKELDTQAVEPNFTIPKYCFVLACYSRNAATFVSQGTAFSLAQFALMVGGGSLSKYELAYYRTRLAAAAPVGSSNEYHFLTDNYIRDIELDDAAGPLGVERTFNRTGFFAADNPILLIADFRPLYVDCTN